MREILDLFYPRGDNYKHVYSKSTIFFYQMPVLAVNNRVKFEAPWFDSFCIIHGNITHPSSIYSVDT